MQNAQHLFSFKNLYNAYISCRKHKRNTFYAAKFEANFERELLKLSQELKSHTYQPNRSICFAISDPKLREVWAADFRDRVVHHLLVSRLEPIWEKIFIFHSYACRRKKGAHRAVHDLKKIAGKNLFFLQIDIQSFFVTINKSVLYSLIAKRVKNSEILWLVKTVIFYDPTKNFIAKGDLKLLQSIPPRKSLFGKINCGLPIGNLTSQFFANLYLNELDQFVKHSLKCRYYFRYMDDLLLIHKSKKQLIEWRNKIKLFIENNLKLKLHPKKQVFQPIRHGINFCGYILKPTHILIRRQTVKRLKSKLWKFNKEFPATEALFNNPYGIFEKTETIEKFKHILSAINSTYGFFKHANCLRLKKTLYEHFGSLKFYLEPANQNYDYFIWKSC